MELSKRTIDIIRFNNIPVNDALTTLLVLFFGLERDNSVMNDDMINQLSVADLIEYDYDKGKYIVKEPLFEEDVIALGAKPKLADYVKRFPNEFIKEYVTIFKNVNKERTADKTSVRTKLGRLISERDNTVTNNEILEAAKLYVSRVSDIRYLLQADHFIWHRDKGFSIMPYIEELRENKTKGISDNSKKFEDTL